MAFVAAFAYSSEAEATTSDVDTDITSVYSYLVEPECEIYFVHGQTSGEDAIGADVMVDGECVAFVESDGTFDFCVEGGGWINIDLYLGDDRDISVRHRLGIR